MGSRFLIAIPEAASVGHVTPFRHQCVPFQWPCPDAPSAEQYHRFQTLSKENKVAIFSITGNAFYLERDVGTSGIIFVNSGLAQLPIGNVTLAINHTIRSAQAV